MEEKQGADEGEINDCPIEQVRLTVPITDDPNLQALTFRTWMLGITVCVLRCVVNTLSMYRQNPVHIPIICIQIAILPIGKFMAASFPTKRIQLRIIPRRPKWTFSINPGPFNFKEHALISMFAISGSFTSSAFHITTLLRIYFNRNVDFSSALMMTLSSQLLGFGFAGLFMKFFVENPYMWWPQRLYDVTFYRTLHEKEKRRKGQLTRLQFLMITVVSSFSYYIVPGYFFPSISAISIVCLIWKNSITAQQIGSGRNGLGIGSFGLDWLTISGFLGDPLCIPAFVINNLMVGFIIALYIIAPIAYWNNWYEAKRFPFFSSGVFDINGQKYNITRVIKNATFEFDENGYNNYSKPYFSAYYIFSYGFIFASVTAGLLHSLLYHGKPAWLQFKDAYEDPTCNDVHARLMKKYKPIPKWWFGLIFISTVICGIISSIKGLGETLDFSTWIMPLACILGLIFLFPSGVLDATTSQLLPLNMVGEMISGYLFPGKPLANMVFKTYSSDSCYHALMFLSYFKLGHYLKIPPRSMFVVQVVGSTIAACIGLSTLWYLQNTIENFCKPEALPKGSPWTCPGNAIAYSSTAMWGVIGPGRLFVPHGIYSKMYLFFVFGVVATLLLWKLSKVYSENKWLKLINLPIILSASTMVPPGSAVNIWPWWIVGMIFNVYVFNKHKGWWAKYNYVLSFSLSAGSSLLALFLYLTLNRHDVYGPDWWGLDIGDHCPLAKCPTAPNIVVKGCPVFQ